MMDLTKIRYSSQWRADNALTDEQKRRVKSAMEETKRFLDKEKKYGEDLQNKKLIKEYEEHLKKLEKMLSGEIEFSVWK